jgi:hypothetical protein
MQGQRQAAPIQSHYSVLSLPNSFKQTRIVTATAKAQLWIQGGGGSPPIAQLLRPCAADIRHNSVDATDSTVLLKTRLFFSWIRGFIGILRQDMAENRGL